MWKANYMFMPQNAWLMALAQILTLVVFALCIAGVVLLVTRLTRTTFGKLGIGTVSESPDEILRTRFAKGEITREQFDEMLYVLHP